MNAPVLRALAIAGMALLAACSGGSVNSAVPSQPTAVAPMAGDATNVRAACPEAEPPGFARCFALIRTDVTPQRGVQPDVNGYKPNQLQAAYNLPSATNGAAQIVGIVDAYDDPKAESDVGVYRAQFGLPACTTQNGCFTKVSQSGSHTKFPSPNPGWGGEISLDLDMASAICPNCKIVLVEANTSSLQNLAESVDRAVKLGAKVVSNSYGGSGGGGSNKHYKHPGTMITASSGDSGYGPSSPCDYATVVCVGGTSLHKTGNKRGWSEQAWRGAGSGCATLVKKPTWQNDQGCTHRSEADVAAVADPQTGVATYDTFGSRGWGITGGTSVSSPIIASVFALAGNASTQDYAQGIWAAGGTSSLNDVTEGSNGNCPTKYPYICQAGPGYDGPTGWGTPNGLGAF